MSNTTLEYKDDNGKTINKRTWQEFSDTGILWWINRILHTFGWSIVTAWEEDGAFIEAYPCRTTWLGFPPETNSKRLAQFQVHMRQSNSQERPTPTDPYAMVWKGSKTHIDLLNAGWTVTDTYPNFCHMEPPHDTTN